MRVGWDRSKPVQSPLPICRRHGSPRLPDRGGNFWILLATGGTVELLAYILGLWVAKVRRALRLWRNEFIFRWAGYSVCFFNRKTLLIKFLSSMFARSLENVSTSTFKGTWLRVNYEEVIVVRLESSVWWGVLESPGFVFHSSSPIFLKGRFALGAV